MNWLYDNISKSLDEFSLLKSTSIKYHEAGQMPSNIKKDMIKVNYDLPFSLNHQHTTLMIHKNLEQAPKRQVISCGIKTEPQEYSLNEKLNRIPQSSQDFLFNCNSGNTVNSYFDPILTFRSLWKEKFHSEQPLQTVNESTLIRLKLPVNKPVSAKEKPNEILNKCEDCDKVFRK